MQSEELLAQLKLHSSADRKLRVARLGIPESNSLGVSLPDIRRIAKMTSASSETARQLWSSKIHEARLLAALLFVPGDLTPDDATGLVADVESWDLCDHLCNNLFLRMEDYPELIDLWFDADPVYTKRAAFALIASAATHARSITPGLSDRYLAHIESQAGDDRVHVKKAVLWALREVGQRDLRSRDSALTLADSLIASNDRHRTRLGQSARKEIEQYVEVPGRRRLVPVRPL